ncbi:MAG TPA: RDD family protein [Terriglobales bacterium]|nr:RDD family protein [Terriglobales bacterium]
MPALVPAGTPESTAAVGLSSVRPASLGDRLIAAVLDHVVILGACAVVSVWSFRRWGVAGESEFQLTTASIVMAAMLSTACAFVYLWLSEVAFQSSLGKAIVGLRLVRAGTRGRLAAYAIRNALRPIDGLGFYFVGGLVAGCSRLRQRLGDMAAGTVVVEEAFSGGVKALAVLLWFASFVLSGWGVLRVSAHPLRTTPPSHLGGTVAQVGYATGSAHMRTARWRIELQFTSETPSEAQVNSH